MRYAGHSYERLDGTKKAAERSAAVVRFNNPALHRFVMLLSTRAGGLGLNLTAADTVIIYDSDWNPHNDLQAQARAHRIGQTKAVKVYRLLTRKSYEIEMFHAASMKLGLDRAVLAHQRAEGEQVRPTHPPTSSSSPPLPSTHKSSSSFEPPRSPLPNPPTHPPTLLPQQQQTGRGSVSSRGPVLLLLPSQTHQAKPGALPHGSRTPVEKRGVRCL